MRCLPAGDPENDEEEEGAEPPWQDALLDVQLALLSRPSEALPSAPLRDAVEALFRATCHLLTRTGELPTRPVGSLQQPLMPPSGYPLRHAQITHAAENHQHDSQQVQCLHQS